MSTPPSSSAAPGASNAGQPRSRQELYEQIRASGGKEAFIVQEMTRLGFWPREGELPDDPADEIRREGELRQKLAALRTEQSRLYNEEKLLKALRKQRLKESREKKAATKDRRLKERKDRAEAWKKQKATDIGYLGADVSGGLSRTEANLEKLRANGLPNFKDPLELSAAMGISVGELRFLSYSRKVSRTNHYKRFLVPKKTGGHRLISAPMPRLKEMQAWVAEHILNKVKTHDCGHGFIRNKNVVTGAKPHVGQDVVINLDLKDFFPTVTFRRVKGMFRSLGYSEQIAVILALMCSEPVTQELELDGETFYVGRTGRQLPQGAPSSPAITNVICRSLDKRLLNMAKQHGYHYTRYADDLSFSARGEAAQNAHQIIRNVNSIVSHEGFTVHPDKTRVMRRGRRQEVTGVVVNEKLGVERKRLRQFRAAIHRIENQGLKAARFGSADGAAGDDVLTTLEGFAAFVYMVDAKKGRTMLDQVRGLRAKLNAPRPHEPIRGRPERSYKRYEPATEHQVGQAAPASAAASPAQPADGGDKKKPWWKVW